MKKNVLFITLIIAFVTPFAASAEPGEDIIVLAQQEMGDKHHQYVGFSVGINPANFRAFVFVERETRPEEIAVSIGPHGGSTLPIATIEPATVAVEPSLSWFESEQTTKFEGVYFLGRFTESGIYDVVIEIEDFAPSLWTFNIEVPELYFWSRHCINEVGEVSNILSFSAIQEFSESSAMVFINDGAGLTLPIEGDVRGGGELTFDVSAGLYQSVSDRVHTIMLQVGDFSVERRVYPPPFEELRACKEEDTGGKG